jgi:hypothetical protein
MFGCWMFGFWILILDLGWFLLLDTELVGFGFLTKSEPISLLIYYFQLSCQKAKD